jgi:hypothetical protein
MERMTLPEKLWCRVHSWMSVLSKAGTIPPGSFQ